MENYLRTDFFSSQDASVDDAHEIGSGPKNEIRDAMRIGKVSKSNPTLVYLGETQLNYSVKFRLLEDAARKRWRYSRLEFQIATNQTEISAGHELVIAQYPYSSGWIHHALFKPRTRLNEEEQAEELSRYRFTSLEHCMEWVEKHPYDYWEKDKILTAAISIPADAASPSPRVRNTSEPPVFGICHDFTACEQQLLDTPDVQKLLSQAKNNTLKFAYSERRHQKLHKAVQEAAPSLMVLSIRQALAGPHKDSEKRIGEPVTKYIAEIFCEHLDNRNRAPGGEPELALGDDAIDYYAYRK